ncbi:MAG: type I glyceraldehyde-3-phosphate dehydrogenase [Candidatus Veblenbacteria bacterium]|nr:type I glyceraldehyde-3-phosphate dehydrogenase [Candidatus Veblenbacteria bacterium]
MKPTKTTQPVRVAINGFGRIGRAAFKVALTKPNVKVVAINDVITPEVAAYLLKYDTVFGQYAAQVSSDAKNLIVDGVKYPILNEREPAKLPWKKLNVDVALECTGRFVKKQDVVMHIKAGAKKVILSAPVKGGGVPTYILGVNAGDKQKMEGSIFSNASCTTNCISPIAAVIQSAFGVEKAMMTTVHSYTADQNLVDGPHKDLRRARAAAQNIVPTTTGAAIATAETIPELKGIFDGMAIRVPTACVSLSDFTFVLKRKKVTKAQVNSTLRRAAGSKRYKGILQVTNKPLVSSDFIGNPASAIADLSLTQVVGGNMVKVVAWYDNEWGYANRLVEMTELVA